MGTFRYDRQRTAMVLRLVRRLRGRRGGGSDGTGNRLLSHGARRQLAHGRKRLPLAGTSGRFSRSFGLHFGIPVGVKPQNYPTATPRVTNGFRCDVALFFWWRRRREQRVGVAMNQFPFPILPAENLGDPELHWYRRFLSTKMSDGTLYSNPITNFPRGVALKGFQRAGAVRFEVSTVAFITRPHFAGSANRAPAGTEKRRRSAS